MTKQQEAYVTAIDTVLQTKPELWPEGIKLKGNKHAPRYTVGSSFIRDHLYTRGHFDTVSFGGGPGSYGKKAILVPVGFWQAVEDMIGDSGVTRYARYKD